MIRNIDGKLVVMGNIPATGSELGKAFSSANFQALGQKPAATQPSAARQDVANTAAANTGAPAKP